MLGVGLSSSAKVGKDVIVGSGEEKLLMAFREAERIMLEASQQPSKVLIFISNYYLLTTDLFSRVTLSKK